jgi:FkbM family methyltransferase
LDTRLGSDLSASLSLGLALARRLGDGRRARLKIVTLSVWLAVLGRQLRRPVVLRLRAGAIRVRFSVLDFSTLQALGEVFLEEQYAVDLPEPPKRILDLGSHLGASVLYFRSRYPQARIVAVEPSASLFPILCRNLSGLADLMLHRAAVQATPGTTTFWDAPQSWLGSTTPPPGARQPTRVDVVTIDSLCDAEGWSEVDLLKLDIEGAEFEALEVIERPARFRAVVGELHASPGSENSDRVLARFSSDFVVQTNSPGPGVNHTIFSAVRRDES